jgi:DNA invertase Pin-like site-specific DNA recombinase
MDKGKRVALYLRVSTDGQTTANQQRELEAVAERQGWTVAEIFQDRGISGTKGRDKRPAFDRMLKAAIRREFDAIAAWSVDRLGRSLQDLVAFLADIHLLGRGHDSRGQATTSTYLRDGDAMLHHSPSPRSAKRGYC